MDKDEAGLGLGADEADTALRLSPNPEMTQNLILFQFFTKL